MTLIDIDEIRNLVKEDFKDDVPYEWAWVLTVLDCAPTIDAAPVVHGRWLKDRDGDEYCSKCSRYMPVSEVTGDPSAHDYCPNCGAKMDGVPDG